VDSGRILRPEFWDRTGSCPNGTNTSIGDYHSGATDVTCTSLAADGVLRWTASPFLPKRLPSKMSSFPRACVPRVAPGAEGVYWGVVSP